MQYYQPSDEHLFFGDPMPFFHDGVFHLYYLLDADHHQANRTLGGAQVAHASSRDLVNWEHHPLAIPTGPPGACDQYTICTGSPFVHDGTWYFWYATRMVPEGGAFADHTQHVCLATGTDGIHFEKDPGNPILHANDRLRARHFRDPVVFRDSDTGLFHMLVTSQLAEEPVFFRNGALAHLTSTDLRNWVWQEPFLVPGLNTAPECPDHFEWNGWYYLTFLVAGQLHYRVSRHPLGPWTRPRVDTLDGPLLKAMKSAAFTGNRRIGVGFLSSRQGYKDGAKTAYAGNAVFRELLQNEDGTLDTSWPQEIIPASGRPVAISPAALTGSLDAGTDRLRLSCPEGFGACVVDGMPVDAHLHMEIEISEGTPHAGLLLCGTGTGKQSNELRFSPFERRVILRNFWTALSPEHMLLDVGGLDRRFTLDIIQIDSVVDLRINGRRTLATRLYDNRGDRLFFFVENGEATFANIEIRALDTDR